jgi:hypothetical protein
MDYTTLLFGEKKIGKTSLAAQFPDAMFMMFEPGGKALSLYQEAVEDWKTAKRFVKLLHKDKRFRYVVVDTADQAFKRCSKHICAKLGIEHPSDEGYGKGWEALRNEFDNWVIDLIACRKGIMFISHATEKEISKRDGIKYHKILPTMSNQARDVLEPVVDLWLYYGYRGEKRTLTVRGSDHIGAGHRLTNHFKGVRSISMGTSPEEAYKNFMDAFHNRYRKVARSIKRRK